MFGVRLATKNSREFLKLNLTSFFDEFHCKPFGKSTKLKIFLMNEVSLRTTLQWNISYQIVQHTTFSACVIAWLSMFYIMKKKGLVWFYFGYITTHQPWCNGYRRRKWTRQHEFKSWTRLIAFHIALIPLGKVWIQLFSLRQWVNSRTDWVLQPWWGN